MRWLSLAGMTSLALVLSACGGGTDTSNPADTPTSDATEGPATTEETPVPTQTAAVDPADGSETVAAPAMAAIDPPAGFAMCKACHSTEPGKQGIGPSLAGVYGTKAGEVAGFEFSEAMIASGLTWDDATLDAYLQNPRKIVPGTKMSFGGMNDTAKRKEVIAFLKAIK